MKNQLTFVEIKTVQWTKDSHGLFDYESQNVNYTKAKIDNSAKVYKEGNEIMIKKYQRFGVLKRKRSNRKKKLCLI